MAHAERVLFDAHREYLSVELHSAVLNFSAGIGTMFPYFEAVAVWKVPSAPHQVPLRASEPPQ